MTIATLSALVGTKLHTSLPVVDRDGNLVGLMTYKEIHRAMASGKDFDSVTVGQFMKRNPAVVYTDETCDVAFNRMKAANQGISPVVKRKKPRKIVGILTYRHIYEAYQKALMY